MINRFLLALVMAFAPVLGVQATCPQYFYPTYSAPYVAPTPIIKQSNAYYIFTPGLAIGLYGGEGGHGPAPQAAKSSCETEIKSLRAELDAIRSRLTVQQAPQSPQPAAAPRNASTIVQHCAECHDASLAKNKGNSIELTAFGQALKLSPALSGKVIASSNPVKGSMPKDHPRLTGEQFNEIIKELIAQQSQ